MSGIGQDPVKIVAGMGIDKTGTYGKARRIQNLSSITGRFPVKEGADLAPFYQRGLF
jgi:hypothetical protein